MSQVQENQDTISKLGIEFKKPIVKVWVTECANGLGVSRLVIIQESEVEIYGKKLNDRTSESILFESNKDMVSKVKEIINNMRKSTTEYWEKVFNILYRIQQETDSDIVIAME